MSQNMILKLDVFVLSLDDSDLQWICNLSTLHLLDIGIGHVGPIKLIVNIVL